MVEDKYLARAAQTLLGRAISAFEVTAEDGADLYHLEKAFVALGCDVRSDASNLKLLIIRPERAEA